MSISSVATEDAALGAHFSQVRDRHQHVVRASERDWLISCEGDSHEDWPPSPPLQQLSVEDLGSGPVALLVGMAGHSHWSLSVEAQQSALVFDAACRVRGSGNALGSAYDVQPDIDVEIEASQARLSADGRTLLLSVDHDDSLEQVTLNWNAAERQLQIQVVEPVAEGVTARWRYRVS